MTLDTTTTETDTPTETTATTTKAARVTATHDIATKIITYSDGTILDCSGVAGDLLTWAMMRGIDAATQGDPARLTKLLAEGPPKPRGEKKPALSVRQQAVVNALVEATKKAETPHTVETATVKVAAMDTKALNAAHKDPLVIKHHRKLTGEAAPSLLDLAG